MTVQRSIIFWLKKSNLFKNPISDVSDRWEKGVVDTFIFISRAINLQECNMYNKNRKKKKTKFFKRLLKKFKVETTKCKIIFQYLGKNLILKFHEQYHAKAYIEKIKKGEVFPILAFLLIVLFRRVYLTTNSK